MIVVWVPCSGCNASGRVAVTGPHEYPICPQCAGLGKDYAEGGPGFGCATRISSYNPGDRLVIGTAQRETIELAWHSPRDEPVVTAVRVIDEWDETIGEIEIVPSGLGVRSIVSRMPVARANEGRGEDLADPLRPKAGGLL